MQIPCIGSEISPPEPASPEPLSEEQRSLMHAVKAINAAQFFGPDDELAFVFHRPSKRMLTWLVKRRTGAVVQNIPPEYVLRLAEEIHVRG